MNDKNDFSNKFDINDELPKYAYRGFFVDNAELMSQLNQSCIHDLGKMLMIPDGWKETLNKHITTSFQDVAKCTHSDIGTTGEFFVNSLYINKNMGIALEVDMLNCKSDIAKEEFYATKEERPTHITIAVAPGVKPAEMGKMIDDIKNGKTNPGDFVKIDFDAPFILKASYAGHTFDKKAVFGIGVDRYSPCEKEIAIALKEALSETKCPYAKALLAGLRKDIGEETMDLKKMIDKKLDTEQAIGSTFVPHLDYGDVISAFVHSAIRETTEENIAQGNISKNQRTFEIAIAGQRGVVNAKDLPDGSVVFVDRDPETKKPVLFCPNMVREETETATLVFFTNKDGECTYLEGVYIGDELSVDKKQTIELQPGTAYTKEEIIDELGEDAVVKYLSSGPVRDHDRYKDDFVDSPLPPPGAACEPAIMAEPRMDMYMDR